MNFNFSSLWSGTKDSEQPAAGGNPTNTTSNDGEAPSSHDLGSRGANNNNSVPDGSNNNATIEEASPSKSTTATTETPPLNSSARTTSKKPSATAAHSFISASNAASAAKPKAKQSSEQKCWPEDALNHPLVRSGIIQLSKDGGTFYCTLCDQTLQVKGRYNLNRLNDKDNHTTTDKHKTKVQARELSEKYDAKRKAEGKSVVSRKNKKQTSLFDTMAPQKKKKSDDTVASIGIDATAATVATTAAAAAAVVHAQSDNTCGTVNASNNNCNGIIPMQRLLGATTRANKVQLETFAKYAPVANVDYDLGFVGKSKNRGVPSSAL